MPTAYRSEMPPLPRNREEHIPDYELQRDVRVEENKKRMLELGLLNLSQKLISTSSLNSETAGRPFLKNATRSPKPTYGTTTTTDQTPTPRRSSRTNLDPYPDWNLDELKVELNALEQRRDGPTLHHSDRSLPLNPSSISWRAPSAITNFGRASGPFIMRVFDDDESGEENDFSDEDKTEASEGSIEVLSSSPQEGKRSLNLGCDDLEFEMAGGLLLPKTDVTDATLLELERERLHRVKEDLRQRRMSFETSLLEEVDKSLRRLTQVKKDEEQKFEIARRLDKQYQRSIAETRDYFISEMQRDHEQRSQVEERKIRKDAAAEEARRREIALREAHERELKAQLEAEAKVKADLILQAERRKLAAERDRKQQAEAAALAGLRRAEERNSKEEEAQCKKDLFSNKAALVPPVQGFTSISSADLKPRVSEMAAKLETERFQKLRSLQESTNLLLSNPSLTKGLKSLERLTVKILQQVSATQEQVRKKSFELTALLTDSNNPQQFMMLTLASKLLSQCESQILKLPSFSFPLAQVVVNVAAQIPFLMDVVLAKLNAACIFTVPKYFIFSKGYFKDDISYYKTLGYQVGGEKLESTDEYLSRMIAYVNFYAAITQTEALAGTNPHGLNEAWLWCARLLNKVPANRYSASALEAVLKIAGFRLYQVYPKAFIKLMQSILNEFLVNLKRQSDPDLRAVINRLETYFQTQQFRIEPEGRQMPPTDLSSSMRA